MIDLTEITESVTQKTWDETWGYAETAPYADLAPQDKVTVKGRLLPLIAETARLTEEAVRAQVAAEIRLLEVGMGEARRLERPLRRDAVFPNDFANDLEWAAQIAEGE